VLKGGERDVSKNGTEQKKKDSPGDLWVSFDLAALRDMGVGLDFGVGLHLPYKNAADKDVAMGTDIGFGASFNSGDFGAKLRLGVKLNPWDDTYKATGGDVNLPTKLGVAILPYYNLGALKAFLNVGLGMSTEVENNGVKTEAVTDWYFNPYIQVPVGGLNFWAGFKVGSDGQKIYGKNKDSTVTNWAVPIGFSVGF